MSELKQYRITAASAAELARGIEDAVASGELSPGERLPSVRRLASLAGLSPATVSSAIAELRRRGVVVSEPRRGTRIGEGPPIGRARAPLPVPPGARDLSRGNPDPALLPDLGAALAHLTLAGRLYGEAPVDPGLAAAASAQLAADGVPLAGVCVTSGALDAIERVMQAHLRTGDAVAVENPGYAALYDLLRARGLVLAAVAIDDRGMLPGALRASLERGARAVVITPRGQNPTGAAIDAQRAGELRAVLGDFPAVLVIEDDHLGQVAGVELHSTLGARTRWAATRSVAKALGPDLRLAVLTGDPRTLARVQGRQQCGPGWVSHLLQSLVLSLWRDPQVQTLVAGATKTYRERREYLIECLSACSVEAHGVSGLNVWVPVPEEAQVVAAMLQLGWVLAPGAPHRLGAASPAVRVTTATLGAPEADRLARDLAAVLAPGGVSRSG